MANQLYHYGYSPTNGGASPSSPAAAAVVGAATSLSSGRYLPTDMYFPQRKDSSSLWYPSYAASDIDIGPPGVATRNSTSAVGATSSTTSNLLSQASWPAAIAAAAAAANAGDPIATNMKRSSDALYHPTALLAHNTIGQSEAWYSTSSLTKRPRYENASNLPIYPQRPGEKDCAHYMLTRTCKFGDSCKFDHPIWVPEGGIPDWKEVPNVATETLPERPGEPDCPYFVKTQRCKFGPRCKFNHPKDLFENADVSGLPERPTEPPCAFYMKTGRCKFGVTCKFHHPRDIQIQLSVEQNGAFEHTQFAANAEGATGDTTLSNPFMSYTYPSLQNSKGLPIRLGEVDCPFYMKTGSCKYGATCRYNHPDWSVAGFGYSVLTSAAANLNLGIVNPAASIYQAIDPTLSNATVGIGQTVYPQRPGQIECDFYMKTGICKFGERCRFHHPIDRSVPSVLNSAAQETVKLTLAGLPRREGSVICPYYLKTGACKFGATCKFDHPPPGEVMEKAKSQTTSASNGEGEANDNEKGADSVQ